MTNPSWVLPRLLSFAESVGANHIVLHTPRVRSTDAPGLRRFVEAIEECQSHGDSSVRVTLENAGHYHESDQGLILHDARRLRDFVDRHDLLLTLDTSHAGTMAQSLITTYEILRDRVVNVHLSDLLAPRAGPRWQLVETIFRHHQIPGRGMLPLAELVRLLHAQSYDGACTLEMSPVALEAWSPTRMRRNLTEAVDFVRGLGPASFSLC